MVLQILPDPSDIEEDEDQADDEIRPDQHSDDPQPLAGADCVPRLSWAPDGVDRRPQANEHEDGDDRVAGIVEKTCHSVSVGRRRADTRRLARWRA